MTYDAQSRQGAPLATAGLSCYLRGGCCFGSGFGIGCGACICRAGTGAGELIASLSVGLIMSIKAEVTDFVADNP
jgi:hypothetical protein